MLQSVHSVLIGKTCPASYTTADALAAGDVALFNENKALIKTAAEAATASSLYVGVAGSKINVTMPDGSVAQKANIDFSNEIKKNSKPSAVIGEYVAPVEEKIVITLTDATIVAGNRYVLRIVYKDMYEAAWQFTHTYEVYAESTTAADLAAAIVKKINAHKNRRVQATVSSAVITLTAMPKDDNEGVDSLNEYSVVTMEASLYETIPGALLANQPKAVAGATIAKTVGNPGKGYWKQVRDAEVRNMGYKGHVFTGAYPSVEQTRKVVEGAEYDYAIIENDNLYLSNDNQYIKTTPLTTEVYCPSLVGSIVDKGIQSFISGAEVK
ncbi:hypothetical protein [uncultured phage cr125_1]|jgi:hypothetical protein|uniref:Uncharacterized protein n=1 Tax=uncultured phage cr125_1 TaxID=2772091 RepID=A0A7M1RV43_9CAUD|nr:hypothetical protein KNV58_gp046 [uncultured phage cr125_1]QOR57559.1 hypothetical protein [uncultured phage cr125_1]DAW32133.1 MAG TPA: hypothetical protein [Caudoviricetes sp.]